MTDEELKHQELFRRLEAMMAADMPAGYAFDRRAERRRRGGAGKRTWAVLALTLDIELFTQAHYRASIDRRGRHCRRCGRTCSCSTGGRSRSTRSSTSWSWLREDARLTRAERDAAVDDLIALVGAVDGILQAQAAADARYFLDVAGARSRPTSSERRSAATVAQGLPLAVHRLRRAWSRASRRCCSEQ